MEIRTGNPPTEGRYMAFVRCQGHHVGDWVEPIIANWHGGNWHGGKWHCFRPVLGWFGPIPPMTARDMLSMNPEYDL